MIILGWFPVVGPFIAGLVAALIARGGGGRRAIVGFLSGVVGETIIVAILTIVGTAAFGPIVGFIGFLAGLALLVLSLGGAIIALIGGAIGGLIAR